MSNFSRIEYCRNCIQMTNHNWYDNWPKQYEYTIECQKCKLRTHESDWSPFPKAEKEMNPLDKISLMTIETAIDLAKTCRSRRQIIKELEKWLAERKAKVEANHE